MKRVAFTWRIKPEAMGTYVSMHNNPWPELQSAIKDAGFGNYSIHMVGHQCFGYFETETSGEACMLALGEYPVFKEWERIMTPLQEEEAFPGCGQRFMFMEQIYLNA